MDTNDWFMIWKMNMVGEVHCEKLSVGKECILRGVWKCMCDFIFIILTGFRHLKSAVNGRLLLFCVRIVACLLNEMRCAVHASL